MNRCPHYTSSGPVSFLEISWESSAFQYGYLCFFAHPERIIIEQITVNGRTALQEAQSVERDAKMFAYLSVMDGMACR
jgi:hypothetical protein